ncbi:hypothetical protein [Paenibacillus odorifer]|uniref:hypothetical protein n=1 Tax=Paenibacillus odorifer TaxID=189426 RepID=UPI0015C3C8EC|nr:hypothetical protein [Paenibacillus odorifer]
MKYVVLTITTILVLLYFFLFVTTDRSNGKKVFLASAVAVISVIGLISTVIVFEW